MRSASVYTTGGGKGRDCAGLSRRQLYTLVSASTLMTKQSIVLGTEGTQVKLQPTVALNKEVQSPSRAQQANLASA